MKRIYHKILSFFESIPVFLEILKYHIFERLKMVKDRKVYSKQDLTVEEKKKIDLFWKQNYGRKINYSWHQYYKLFTGEFDEKFFPQIFYSTELEHKLNSWPYSQVLSDKNLMNSLFADTVYCPKIYGKRWKGNFFDKDGEVVSYEDFVKQLNDIGKVIIKPTVGSSSGKDIQICNFCGGIDRNSGKTIVEVIEVYESEFNIQEYIEQSAVLREIYPDSVNTFRVITYIANNGIHVAPIAMRFGTKGNVVDNIHAGGVMVGVKEDGRLNKCGFLEYGDKLVEHPDTHVIFEKFLIPSVDKIIKTAKQLHKKVACLGMISWDFTLDENNEVVLIEVNLKGQSVCFPQEVHGKGIFGEQTSSMLQRIKH